MSTRGSRVARGPRGARWRGAAIAGALVVAALVVAFVVLPRVAARAIEENLRARVGGQVTCDDVSLGVFGVGIGELDVRLADGSITARTVSVSFGEWLGWARGSGPTAVRAESVTIEGDAQSLVRVLRGQRGATAGGSRAPFDVHVERVSIAVTDRDGPLVTLPAAELDRSGGATHVLLRALELGSGADAARIGELELRLEGRAVTELAVRDAELAVGAPGRRSLVTRLREAIARPAAVGAEPREEGDDDEPGAAHWFASGAQLSASGVRVVERRAGVTRVLGEQITATASRTESGELRSHGEGRVQGGGSIHWDVRVTPSTLAAEGDLTLDAVPLALVTPLLPELPLYQPEATHLSGEAHLRTLDGDRVSASGTLEVTDLAVEHPRIAPGPVHASFVIEGAATLARASRRIELEEASLRMGGARASLHGVVEWARDHYLFDLVATLPPTPCNAAIHAIPRDLLQDTSGFSFEGELGARLTAHVDSRDLDHATLVPSVADGCRFESVPQLADLRRFEQPFTHRVVEPDGTVFEMTTGPGTRHWVPIEAVSPFLLHAVLAHEDGGFFRHHGFAPAEIQVALVRNLRAGRYVQGASTITMQLVKNVFLHREKTLARKIQEVLLTWWIEQSWEKRDILELYLNVVELGPGIYGVRDGALHWFGREPADLSPAESALLATLLPSPKTLHQSWDDGVLTRQLAARTAQLVRRMENRGRIDAASAQYGLDELARGLVIWREGMPPPPERVLPTGATPLPFQVASEDGAAWQEAMGEPEDVHDPEVEEQSPPWDPGE